MIFMGQICLKTSEETTPDQQADEHVLHQNLYLDLSVRLSS
jgi:hypothetical protein